MGVRVRVKTRYAGSAVDTVALVNTGYETDVPDARSSQGLRLL